MLTPRLPTTTLLLLLLFTIAPRQIHGQYYSPCPVGQFRCNYCTGVPCRTCAAGQTSYNPSNGRTNWNSCYGCSGGRVTSGATNVCGNSVSACGTGKYSTGGNAACQFCPRGYYQTSAVSASCSACGRGGYENGGLLTLGQENSGPASGNGPRMGCTACDVGQYQYSNGGYTDKYGYWQPPGGGPMELVTETGRNPSGFINHIPAGGLNIPDAQITYTSCIKCPKGWHQDLTSSGTCKQCLAGLYQNELGIATCKNCAVGKWRALVSAVTEAARPYVSGHSCVDCPPGTYTDELGSDSTLRCKPCEVGKHHAASRASCTSCAAGKYQDQQKQGECVACPRNKYSNEEGMATCKDCSVESYQPVTADGWSLATCTKLWIDGTTYTEADSRGCLHNPYPKHVNALATDCSKTEYGGTCKVVCQGGYVSSGLATCDGTLKGWTATTCDRVLSYNNGIRCSMSASGHADCKKVV